MIPRYTTQEMAKTWSEVNIKQKWHEVETAVLGAKEKLGLVPTGAAQQASDFRIDVDVLKSAYEMEEVTDHDLIAFVWTVTNFLEEAEFNEAAEYYHDGLTSYDVEDTAIILIMRESLGLIYARVQDLEKEIEKKAVAYRDTIQIGRTHFIHAEPVSFGAYLLNFLDAIKKASENLRFLYEEKINVGKISGAVGGYSLDPKIEELACSYLDLLPSNVSTQILNRNIFTEYANGLAQVASAINNIALNIRLLAGTDIGEVAEGKRLGAKGSSAMPGKSLLRNPIKSENLCGLAKTVKGFQLMAQLAEETWLQRSLDNSSAERIWLPGITKTVEFMVVRATSLIKNLTVSEDKMWDNLGKTKGVIFAQKVMMALVKKGMARKDAYEMLEAIALKLDRRNFEDDEGKSFKKIVLDNEVIKKYLSEVEIFACFGASSAKEHTDVPFKRVVGGII